MTSTDLDRIPVSEVTSLTLRQKDNINPISSHCQDIYQVVKKGLGDRASLICIHYPKRAPSSVHSSYSSIESTGSLDVGLLLNAEQVHRTVDRGPYAEEKDTAAAFRTFWGEKAELRRFQDGSIQESLVWKGPESGSKPIEQIIRYVFQRHFKKPLSEVTKGIRNFFALSDQNRSHGARYSTLWDPAKEFRSFEKDIWAIEGLPLQIHQVSAASSELWQSQPSSSISGNHQYPKAPLDVNVQLEWSSRWPHDLNAALRTKIALLQKIGQSLKDFIPGQEVQLGLESEEDRFWSGAYLDITRPLGVRFHLRIHHDQQLSLLERMLKDADLGIRTKEELISSISKYKRSFIQAPLHAQAIKTLSTKFPFLLPTVRLMKRWRNSHLLSSHVRDELIEMITVRTFVHPHPWKTPASETTGFLRTLYFLGNWNWQTEPLIVDFNSSLEKEDIGSINKRFEAWRKLDPGMNRVAMFAGSDLDSSGIAWTEHQPSKVIAMRIKCLAESAYQMAQEHGLDIDPARMFTPSLKDYDFVIHLDEKFHFSDVSSSESVPQFKNLSTSRDDQQAQASANRGLLQPFIAELESLYGAYVMFFYDADVGSLIAGLWHPQTGPKPWKVSQASCTKPLVSGPEAGAQVEVNRTAILHGIARLGGDMVVNIEVK